MSISTMLEKIMWDFLWKEVDERKGAHLVKWELVSKPSYRGLGIGNLRLLKPLFPRGQFFAG